MIEAALRTHILSKTDITDVIGQRCEFGRLSPELLGLPHVIYAKNDDNHDQTLEGTQNALAFAMFTLEVRAVDSLQIPTISELLVRTLSEIETGATVSVPSVGDVTITEVALLDDGTDEEPVEISREGSTQQVHIRSLICEVGYRRNVSPVS
ncbi:MAG: hypothetical protein ACYTGL_13850 [Planctomycetota bacterium]|jgi:hypothetical protein